MRLAHIFWSLVVLAIAIVLPTILFLNHGKLQGGPEIVGTFLIFWWAIDAITPTLLISAWLRHTYLREKFSFTLLATLNLYFGLMGIFHIFQGKAIHLYPISMVLFLLNIVWTAIIVYYQLKPPHPASQNS